MRLSEKRLLKEEVDAEDIAESVAKATGIPVSKMLQSEREKLLNLEEELHKRVVGQDEAISGSSDAIRRSRPGCRIRNNRLVRLFSWVLPVWVKQNWQKRSPNICLMMKSMMTRIDMSEYQEKHTVSQVDWCASGICGL